MHTGLVTSLLWYTLAALGEIGGCFAFWAWLRLEKSAWWTVPGVASLIVFAIVLTRIEASNAGRTFAAYGGVYIISSILWLWIAEGVRPDRWDMGGSAVALAGAAIIFFGPRSTQF